MNIHPSIYASQLFDLIISKTHEFPTLLPFVLQLLAMQPQSLSPQQLGEERKEACSFTQLLLPRALALEACFLWGMEGLILSGRMSVHLFLRGFSMLRSY